MPIAIGTQQQLSALQHAVNRGPADVRVAVIGLPDTEVTSTERRPGRVLRAAHPVPADELDAASVVSAYKNLKYVERDFRHIKADDLDLRPVFHYLEGRVRAHVLICMLACYLT